jgi:hypothetical protein
MPTVGGHEKVPGVGQVVVPAGGRLEVPDPSSPPGRAGTRPGREEVANVEGRGVFTPCTFPDADRGGLLSAGSIAAALVACARGRGAKLSATGAVGRHVDPPGRTSSRATAERWCSSACASFAWSGLQRPGGAHDGNRASGRDRVGGASYPLDGGGRAGGSSRGQRGPGDPRLCRRLCRPGRRGGSDPRALSPTNRAGRRGAPARDGAKHGQRFSGVADAWRGASGATCCRSSS